MKTKRSMTLTLPTDTTIELSRQFDAPQDLVFEVYTNADHVRNWWGCDESVPEKFVGDVRVGGAYEYIMAMDGERVPFKGEYVEVDRPHKVVFTQVYDVAPFNEHHAVVTTTFREESGVTTVMEHIVLPTKEVRDEFLKSGMEDGAEMSFDRIESLLEKLQENRP